MGKVIIGIHGLGNKPSREILEKWWKRSIREGLNRVGNIYPLPDFELIYWADVLHDEPLDPCIKDKTNPLFLKEVYKKSPPNLKTGTRRMRIKFVDFVRNLLHKIFLKNDFSLRYRLLALTILQRYFHELDVYYKEEKGVEESIHKNAKKIIMDRVVKILRKHKDDEIFLIGHSMGSIIAYDVLTFRVPDIKIHTFITMGSPLGFPIVLSKIASRLRVKNDGGAVLTTPENVKSNWYNFSDIDDNIALNYKLKDDFRPNEHGVEPEDILVFNNYKMNGTRNPHKSFGYLRSVKFSEILTAFIDEDKTKLGKKIKVIITKIKKAVTKTPEEEEI